jgi:hypothetical protein
MKSNNKGSEGPKLLPEIKKIIFWLNWTAILSVIAFLLWIGETSFFLIRDGWHITATAPAEIVADKIVGYLWNAAFFCFGIALAQVLYLFYTNRIMLRKKYTNKDDEPGQAGE